MKMLARATLALSALSLGVPGWAQSYGTVNGVGAASTIGTIGIGYGAPGTPFVPVTPQAPLPDAPAAGENHLGAVGGNAIPVTVPQTVTASSAYTSGNGVGGLMTFANAARVSAAVGSNGTSGLIQSVIVASKSAQTGQIDVVFFNANPSSSTCTDKTAVSLASADFDKIIGWAHVTDWMTFTTPSAGEAVNLALPYGLSNATSLYACAIARSAFTFSSTSDISVIVRLLRD